jgi:hypothetical protein
MAEILLTKNESLVKCCLSCKETKLFSEFFKDKSKKDFHTIYCKSCIKIKSDIYIKNNQEKVKEREKNYREKNKERRNKQKSEWHVKNSEKISENKKRRYYLDKEKYVKYSINWQKENSGRVNAKIANREAKKNKATPKWADIRKIQEIYESCSEKTKKENIKYSVDHIIPLNGKNVCGLHVHYNMRIIPLVDNIRKGNRL